MLTDSPYSILHIAPLKTLVSILIHSAAAHPAVKLKRPFYTQYN